MAARWFKFARADADVSGEMATQTIPGAAFVGEAALRAEGTRGSEALGARLGGFGAALLWTPVRVASALAPKDPDLWLFGGCRGERFEGNARHLFQWVAMHRPELRALWCSDDEALLAKLRERELPCVSTYSVEGTKLAMRAGVAVTSHGLRADLHRFAITGRTCVARLGESVYLRRAGADAVDATRGGLGHACLDLLARVFSSERDRFDLVTVSSESQQSHARSTLGARREAIAVTGLARNDLLLHRGMVMHPSVKRVLVSLDGRGFVDRGKAIDPFAGLDPERADRELAPLDAEIYVKAEPWICPSEASLDRLGRSERVHLFGCGDLHHHLDGFDALITDASAVFADYLLLDRPVLFVGDRAAAGAEGYYYDYEWLRCGPALFSWSDVLEGVAGALSGRDEFAEQRARARDVFHAHADGRNCERIVAAIEAAMRDPR